MNNLLFTALIIALLYYFFVYLPSQKKVSINQPTIFNTQATQTEPTADNPELEATIDHLISEIKQLCSKLN